MFLHTHAFGARGTHTFLHTRNERVKKSTLVFLGGPAVNPGPGRAVDPGPAVAVERL